MLCQREFSQITNTHMRSHQITMPEYREQFPDAPTVTEEIRAKVRAVNVGVVRSEETRRRVSENRRGIRPENHSRYVKGSYSPSEETRRKMADARRGQTHTEETKRKIGDAHRGVKETPEATEANRQAQFEYWKDRPGSNTGRVFTEEERESMSLGRLAAEETRTSEYREARRDRLRSYVLGKKRTPEQRETYRRARIKWMIENPETWQKFTNTKLEIEFKAWCDELEIECVPQFFISLSSKTSHPFDFYLPQYHILVECDGPHHWEGPWWSCENPEQTFLEQQKTDQFWTMQAEFLGYTVVRLRGRNQIGDEGSGSIDEQMLKVLGG